MILTYDRDQMTPVQYLCWHDRIRMLASVEVVCLIASAPSQKSWVEMIENDGKLQKMTLMKSWSTEKATSQKSWIDMVENDRV